MNEQELFEMKNDMIRLARANESTVKNIEKLNSPSCELLAEEYIKQYALASRTLSETCDIAKEKFDKFNKNYSIGKEKYEELESIKNDAYKELGIAITTEENILKIECPGIDLHRKKVDSQPYFLRCLKWALSDFMLEEEFAEWKQRGLDERMTISFMHEYPKNDKCYDNDNLDCKNIIDTLDALGYIKSDRGDKLCHIHRGEVTGRLHTTISLFPSYILSPYLP